jgi:hypothetical protein
VSWENEHWSSPNGCHPDCPACEREEKTYRVIWEIDIDADSPRHAAELALEIQRDMGSTATVFKVKERGHKKIEVIDLDKE